MDSGQTLYFREYNPGYAENTYAIGLPMCRVNTNPAKFYVPSPGVASACGRQRRIRRSIRVAIALIIMTNASRMKTPNSKTNRLRTERFGNCGAYWLAKSGHRCFAKPRISYRARFVALRSKWLQTRPAIVLEIGR